MKKKSHRAAFAIAVLFVVQLSAGFAGAQGVTDATVAELARRFSSGIDCKSGPPSLRAWCPLAGLEAASYASPAAGQSFLGVTVALKQGDRLADNLAGGGSICLGKGGTSGDFHKDVTFGAAGVCTKRGGVRRLNFLTFGSTGITFRDITPSNADEARQIDAVIEAVLRAAAGDAAPVKLADDLAGFLREQSAKDRSGGSPVTRGKHGGSFTATSPGRILLVKTPAGSAYVVVEQVPDGIWASIFPVPFK